MDKLKRVSRNISFRKQIHDILNDHPITKKNMFDIEIPDHIYYTVSPSELRAMFTAHGFTLKTTIQLGRASLEVWRSGDYDILIPASRRNNNYAILVASALHVLAEAHELYLSTLIAELPSARNMIEQFRQCGVDYFR